MSTSTGRSVVGTTPKGHHRPTGRPSACTLRLLQPRRPRRRRHGGRRGQPFERVARELGVGEDRLVWIDQVHGSVVAVVDGPQDGPGGRDRRPRHRHARAGPGRPGRRLRARAAHRPGRPGWSPPSTPGREGLRRGVAARHAVGHGEPGGPRPARHRAARARPSAAPATRCRGDAGRGRPVAPAAAVRTRPAPPGWTCGPGWPRCWPGRRARSSRPALHRRGPAAVQPPPRRRHRPPGRPRLAGLSLSAGLGGSGDESWRRTRAVRARIDAAARAAGRDPARSRCSRSARLAGRRRPRAGRARAAATSARTARRSSRQGRELADLPCAGTSSAGCSATRPPRSPG